MTDAKQLEIELLRTRERVRDLEYIVQQQSEALKESSKLLARTRPPRPTIPHDRKLSVAADQGWKCACTRLATALCGGFQTAHYQNLHPCSELPIVHFYITIYFLYFCSKK